MSKINSLKKASKKIAVAAVQMKRCADENGSRRVFLTAILMRRIFSVPRNAKIDALFCRAEFFQRKFFLYGFFEHGIFFSAAKMQKLTRFFDAQNFFVQFFFRAEQFYCETKIVCSDFSARNSFFTT